MKLKEHIIKENLSQLLVKGNLTINQSEEFKAKVTEILNNNLELNINLKGVKSFDSAGLQLILSLKNSDKNVKINDLSESVDKLVKLYNIKI